MSGTSDPAIATPPLFAPAVSANTRARLARRFAKLTQGRFRFVRWLTLVFAVAWLIPTVIGSYGLVEGASWGERLGNAIYGPLTFLTPQDSYLKDLRPADWLWWGRIPGVALPFLALIWAAARAFGTSFARALIRSGASGHVVIVGRDGFADTLARLTSDEGRCVVLIEEGVTPARYADLARAGVIVMPDLASLATALHSARAAQARRVLSWSSSDAQSLADALDIRALLEGGRDEVVVFVDSPDTMRVIRHAPDLLSSTEGRLRPISPTFSAVRRGISDAAMVESALEQQRGDPSIGRVHVQLHGTTSALEIAAMLTLRHNWSIRLGAPWVSYDFAATGRWDTWLRRREQLRAQLQQAMPDADIPEVLSSRTVAGRSDDPLARYSGDPVTWYIVDLGNDDETLAHAYDLASRLVQRSDTPPKVQPVLRRAHSAAGLLAQSKIVGAFADPILLDVPRSATELIARAEDEDAARIHLAYLASQDRSDAASKDWRDLDETFLHANRAAADHRRIKASDAAWARERGMARDELIDRMCRVEHKRWSSERLLDGWIYGPRRIDERRIHDKLVPWDQLSDADKRKDDDQVRLIIDRFYRAEPDAR